jgi:ribosome biogenesis GTPase
MKGIRTTNPVAVGDKVDFSMEESLETGVISKIHQRTNYIIRRSINLSKEAHILAANLDQAVLMVTLANPKTYTAFIDRFLVTAEAYRIPSKIVFNKVDLYTDELNKEMDELISLYEGIGYPCYTTSAKKGQGVDTVEQLLTNKTTLLSGHSGVGKSSIVNAIAPGLDLKTAEISEIHSSGRHTTTYPEMHQLPNGGFIIDTPGIKGFGMVDMEREEISHYFPEMFALLDNCQFYNCTHTHEPKCAVKEAVKEGKIAESRYKAYISLVTEDEDQRYRLDPYA